MKFLVVLFVAATVILYLLLFQHRMIYYPRSYSAMDLKSRGVLELEYRTNQGRQVCFFMPPRAGTPERPGHVWLLFGGNAALALDWYDFCSRYPDPNTGFLLVDYPGYGKCDGKASPHSVLETINAAFKRLAQHLDSDPSSLTKKVSLLGHSLGAAAALQYAVDHTVRGLVLVSPFTSLRDMAVRVVGKPLHMLLLQNYDNEARLAELFTRNRRPQIFIIHGDRDEIIPVAMGRKLAALFPEMITYLEIEGGDHNGILSLAERQIYLAMLAVEQPS